MRIPAEIKALVLDGTLSDGARITQELLWVLGKRAKGMLQEEMAEVRGINPGTYRRHLRELEAHRAKMSASYNTNECTVQDAEKNHPWGDRRKVKELEAWLERERILNRQWAEAGNRMYREGRTRCRTIPCFRLCHYVAQAEPLERVGVIGVDPDGVVVLA